jgi:hypothetical protein
MLPPTKTRTQDEATLQRLRNISHVLDNVITIPGTRLRIGIDPILGLLFGGGDLAGSVMSAYIVMEAARYGVPRSTLVRMLTNLLLDAVVGTVPILGDFFDATWKANSRNLALLEAHAANPTQQANADRGFVVLTIVLLVLIVIGSVTVTFLLTSWLWSLLTQLAR